MVDEIFESQPIYRILYAQVFGPDHESEVWFATQIDHEFNTILKDDEFKMVDQVNLAFRIL